MRMQHLNRRAFTDLLGIGDELLPFAGKIALVSFAGRAINNIEPLTRRMNTGVDPVFKYGATSLLALLRAMVLPHIKRADHAVAISDDTNIATPINPTWALEITH